MDELTRGIGEGVSQIVFCNFRDEMTRVAEAAAALRPIIIVPHHRMKSLESVELLTSQDKSSHVKSSPFVNYLLHDPCTVPTRPHRDSRSPPNNFLACGPYALERTQRRNAHHMATVTSRER